MRPAYTQHGVVDCLVPLGVHTYRLRHNSLNLIRHHAKLPLMAKYAALHRLVVEQVEPTTKRMCADSHNVFFDTSTGTRLRHHHPATGIWCANACTLRQEMQPAKDLKTRPFVWLLACNRLWLARVASRKFLFHQSLRQIATSTPRINP